jgi:O-antigen ligase
MVMVVAFVYLWRVVSISWQGKFKWIFFVVLTFLSVGSLIFLVQFLAGNNQDQFPKKLTTYTKLGNIYLHDTTVKVFENGNALFINYCPKEMDSVWNLRSSLNVDFVNSNHYSVRSVLMRYLTSKGLPKDAEGVSQLTKNDIVAIERGIPNVNSISSSGIIERLNEIKFELSDMNDPNGHSLLQRFEFWKASIRLIQSNFLIGVGAGDMSDALQQTFSEMNSKLKVENRLGSHNQFLDITARIGIVGLSIFVLILVLFFKDQIHSKNIFGVCFICMMITSFLVEDTLNTLTGMSIFSLFFALNLKLNLLETAKN